MENVSKKETLREEPEEYLFTCKECGSHELCAEEHYTTWQGKYYTRYVERGSLNIDTTDDHRVEKWDELEEVESGYDNSVNVDEEEDMEEEVDGDSDEFYVRCVGCDREIEFGWSHPDRGGRIWPAECSDFNPWKAWPEPRYRDAWARRGWLRPQDGPSRTTHRTEGGN